MIVPKRSICLIGVQRHAPRVLRRGVAEMKRHEPMRRFVEGDGQDRANREDGDLGGRIEAHAAGFSGVFPSGAAGTICVSPFDPVEFCRFCGNWLSALNLLRLAVGDFFQTGKMVVRKRQPGDPSSGDYAERRAREKAAWREY